ncbi:MAG: hypothetical protein OER90_17220 [Gemmatimonadota bacterium]|nr:hypothetical protein [Gemmatimonadota bacterium]
MQPDREHMAAFGAAIRTAMESADQEVELPGPNGMTFRVIKHPAPGVQARIEISAGGSATMTNLLWEPAASRPAAYPTELPFIPNTKCGTSTTTAEGRYRAQAQWHALENAGAILEQVVAVSLAEGWEHTAVQPSTPPPTQMVTLQRGDEQRTITLFAVPGAGMVLLSESGPTPAT